MKQTAIEWLEEQIVVRRNGIDNSIPLVELFNEAKELEKQQIKNAWCDGNDNEHKETSDYYAENYFNNTYKQS